MKYSIKKQFALVFIGLMTATLLLCWFINNMFLDKYYINNKKQAIQSAYDVINSASTSGDMWSEEFDIYLQKVIEKYNISIIVLDTNSKTIKTSMHDSDLLSKRLWDNLFNTAQVTEENIVLEEEGNYTIQIMNDPRTTTGYIEMWGVLDNSNIFLIRSALEGIKDSVAISNRFLTYIGIIAVIISGIVIIVVAKKITDPILQLAHISQRIAQLDFGVRYHGKSKTEIAVLGNSINELSQTLETTICELKTANNELKKDIEKKNEIDEMRKEFLSNVSHELKTPIALIQGYAEGLKEGIGEDEESREFYCDVIVDEAYKMNVMVKKLLTLNQLEFGKDIIAMERFDITLMIGNYIQSAEILTKQKGITVCYEVTEPIYVWADEFKAEEVFANYFSNAIHHAQGECVIEVKLIKGNGVVKISVFNSGEPIPQESISYLWDKFYKVDKARTRAYGGSGVGLSIVKAIMEAFRGKYGVENYENGVAFWFELETD